jgi:prolyl-tRNA synthetase
MSQLFARTLREAPADAEAPSQQLLLRGAFIRRLMAGVYIMLPLGLRTLHKIEQIVRQEMDAAGAQEIRMPILLPAEPWKVTGRWQAYGNEMFKLVDRGGRDLGLGPTHEEVVTPVVAGELRSYRDLPVNLYQVEWKYRDELRPRFGLVRAREFLMKDAYSFDADIAGMQRSYEVMVEAYRRVFDRCSLNHSVVEADAGLIGGGVNHEFLAPTAVGEDVFVVCENGDYAADLEAATYRSRQEPAEGHLEQLTEVATPGRHTIRGVVEFLRREPSQLLKTLMYKVDGSPVAVLLAGERELNVHKLRRALGARDVQMFTDDDFAARGLVKGYVGPQGLPEDVTTVGDLSVRGGRNWVAGANKADHHVTGANPGRDFRVDRWEDVGLVREGDLCPRCGGVLRLERAIVVGHTYQLGSRYSEPLEATFLDEAGNEQPFQMGSYGIGISRVLAAVAEQHRDQSGLLWPKALAPYQIVVIAANMDQPGVVRTAECLYEKLLAEGQEVVIDDRNVTAGVKFADADLIGYPVQLVVGSRGVRSGMVDLKLRSSGKRAQTSTDDAASSASHLLQEAP